MRTIGTVEQLHALYGEPVAAATVKVSERITADYRALIEASPFVALATVGPEGLDCSPRGDRAPVARVLDEQTLALPDRRGNNRVDSLANIVRDPRVALLFLIPGSGTTFRVNGRAALCIEPDVLAGFAVDGARPRCVVLVRVVECYFQCARAVVRSALWAEGAKGPPDGLPTPGAMLAGMSAGAEGGEAYDRAWPERAAATLW